jgi:hypothetical protein
MLKQTVAKIRFPRPLLVLGLALCMLLGGLVGRRAQAARDWFAVRQPAGTGNARATAPNLPTAVYTVDNTEDYTAAQNCTAAPNDCSLRAAITLANNSPGNDTINFDPAVFGTPREIALYTFEQFTIANNGTLTIDGPGAKLLSLNGVNLVRVFNVSAGATATISGITIRNGFTNGGEGGGIRNAGNLTVNSCEIKFNTGSGSDPFRFGGGGGIWNVGNLNLINSTVYGNTAIKSTQNNGSPVGGGILNYSGGTANIINSTISGNKATDESGGSGGGIWNEGTNNGVSGVMTLINSTVAGNLLEGNRCDGGGVFNNGGTVNARNTIFAGNTGNCAPGRFNGPDFNGRLVSQGYNLIDIQECFTSGGITFCRPDISGNTTGNILNVNAQLGPLADNGGQTLTHALLAGSPAINAGSNALAVDQNNNPLTTDERGVGFPRINNANVDIGAYETLLLPGNTTTTITADAPDPSNVGQSVTVSYTVTSGAGTPTGNVTVSDGVNSCVGTVAAGSCSLTLNTVGSRTLTASYGGSALFNPSTSAGVPHTVNPSGPLVLSVDNTSDNGALSACTAAANDCSLRGAISRANAVSTNDTINFDAGVFAVSRTIIASNGELSVTNNGGLTINGTGANLLNISGGGGSSRVFNFSTNSAVVLNNLTVSGGNASSGGGILANPTSVTINNCNISGNNATALGGGIYNVTGTMNINSSTISGNTAGGSGGGIANGGNPSVLNISNSTISGNTSNGTGGGGIFTNAQVNIYNSTITNNTANGDGTNTGIGGGISNFTFEAVSLGNTIVAGNNAPNAPDFRDALNSLGNNLIGNTSGTNITGNTNGNLLNVNPLLGSLANNGGPTLTHALSAGSPAINAGNNNLAVDATASQGLLTDQRGAGFPRIINGIVDIGAVENNLPVVTENPQSQTVAVGATVTFTSRAGVFSLTAPNSLASGQALLPGQFLISPNYGYQLIYQPDGNLVLYRGDGAVLWNTGTFGTSPGRAEMQTDGNFVIYDTNNNVQFSAGTFGNPGATLALQDDGNVVIYNGSTAIYSTQTGVTGPNPIPTVQWQVSTDGGANFTNIGGATTPILSFTAQLADNGKQYRAVFTNTFGAVASSAATLTVANNATITTITTDNPDPSVRGQAITVTFTVTSGMPGTPTGNVTVSDGVNSCVGSVAAGACNLALTTVGARTLNATYAGDANFQGSFDTEPHQVNPGNTTTLITAESADPTQQGVAFTVFYSVSSTAPATGTPTGNVTVSDGENSCTGTVAAGQCSLALTMVGNRTLTATYTGDASFNGSVSAGEPHTVNKAGTTTTIIADTPDPSEQGQSFTVAYSVGVVSPGTGTPTGNVTVSDGVNSCVGTVAAGQCSLTLNTIGSRTLTATYAGDTNFNGSVSAGEPHTVTIPSVSLNLIVDNISDDGNLSACTAAANDCSLRGAISRANAVATNDTISFDPGVFSTPQTITLGGTQLSVDDSGALTILGPSANLLTISGNNASRILEILNPVSVSLSGLTLTQGNGTGGTSAFGGALRVFNIGASLNLDSVSVSGNNSSAGGGGVQISFVASANITNSTFSNNTAAFGGGAMQIETPNVVNIINTTISGNSSNNSTSGGGGIRLLNGNGVLNITNSTITNNTTGFDGGGIRQQDPYTVNLRNTIVAGNIDSSGGNAPDMAGTITSQGYNLIGDSSGGTITGTTTGNTLNVNAQLGSLANNGGATLTHALLAGSPAVNAGSNALAVDQNNQPLTTDQRGAGFNRINRGAVDIGAVESDFKGNTTTTIASDIPDPSSIAQPITVIFTVISNSGMGTPTGNVTVSDGVNSCTGTVAAGQCNLALNTAGARTLTATYDGDANFNGSVSAGEPHTVNCPTFTAGTPTGSSAVGVSYSSSVAATPAVNTPFSYRYSLANSTTLPPGLSLDANTGALTGTPTTPGAFNFDIRVELLNNGNPTGCELTQARSITITCVTNPVVTTNADSGSGSLRQAIIDACPGSTITFANTVVSPINLTSGELVINKNLTIQGPGANVLTVQGNDASVVFDVSSDSANLSGMTITKGLGNGGGIYNKAFSRLTLSNATVSGNHNTNMNGAGSIYNSSGLMTIVNCTISGNTNSNGDGGGIFNEGTLTVSNSTISGNSAKNGGGIYSSSLGTLTVSNSTISGNSAKNGGGIRGLVNARNSIIANNSADFGPDFTGTLTSQGHNLIGNTDNTTITGDTTGNLLNVNPQLGPLANNGGPTQTLALLPGSPAINAGNNCVLTANGCGTNDPPTAWTTDQRGFNRQVGSAIDIGAVETNYVLAATGGTPQSAPPNTAFAQALQATLTESGQPVSGVALTFSAPGSGASASFTGNPATTNASGQASVTATANAVTGTYQVTANTTPGLALAASFQLTNECAVVTFTPQPVNPTCNGATNGSLTLVPGGGVEPYQFSLNGGQSFQASATFNGLGAGTYQAVVKDANGCLSAVMPVTLTQQAAVTFSTTPVNPTCNGAANGSLTINATGGSGAFMYSINNGQSFQASATFSGLGAGSYSVVVKDAQGCQTVAGNVTLTQPAAVSFTTAQNNPTCNGATNGSLTINASGGTGALLYSINNGASFNGNPQFNNLAAGTYAVVVKDAQGCQTAASQVTLTQPAALALSPAALASAVVGQPFTQAFTPSGGTGALQVSLTGALPAWLTFNPANATLSGSAPQPATVSFTLVVSDQAGCTSSFPYTLNFVCPAITLAPASLPNGATGAAYTPVTFSAAPAGTSYSLALTGGQLPPGLTFADGVLSGTPTAGGAYSFTLTATGWGACPGARTYTLLIVAVCPALTLNPASLPGGTVGSAFTQSLSASGGAGPYSYAVTGGALPGGLSLTAGGNLSGTPTASGTFSFTVTVTGAAGCTGSRNYTLNVSCPALTWTPASLPNAQAGVAYNQTVTASGAASYSLATGNLPPGLTLNSATGALTGTATAAGTYNFTLQAAAAGGCSGTQPYSIVVSCPTVTVNPGSLPAGTTGTAYSQSLSAAPGGNYSFSKTSGTLPPGLSLSAAGSLSGTPTTAGSYTFSVTATGFGSCTGSRSYTVTINASCAAITLPSLPATGKVGVNYSGNLAATTPSASYTFSVESGALPPGLTINNLFGQLGGKPTTPGTYTFTLKATRSNGCTGTREYSLAISSAQAALARVADYDGDGQSDLTLWSGSTGAWQIIRSRTQTATQQSWGAAGDLTLLGDYDGDGQSDLAVFRPGDGNWYIKRSSDGSALVQAWGAAADVPVPGDYDGDGQTDLAVFRPSEGNWYILKSSDGGYSVTAWGAGYAPYLDVPVPGDYDGDGVTDLAVFRRQTGTWLIKRSSDGRYTSQAWGVGADVPVVGDYDGDGKSDLAVWRGATGEWFVLRSADGGYEIKVWGAAAVGDVPAPGDYDGDGRSDLMVWRASDQTWYLQCSQAVPCVWQAQVPADARPLGGR